MHTVTTAHHPLDNSRFTGKLVKYSPPDENNPDHLIELTEVEWVLPDSSRPFSLAIKYQCEPLAYISGQSLGVYVFRNLEGRRLALECTGSCSIVDKMIIINATSINQISAA